MTNRNGGGPETAKGRGNVIVWPGGTANCQCGNPLAPHPALRHKMEMHANIFPCPMCGVDIMPFGEPKPVGEGKCVCCQKRVSQVKVQVGPKQWEPWCTPCLEDHDAYLVEIGLKKP